MENNYQYQSGDKHCNKCNKINGIRCNVENCYYHDEKCNCLAGEIQVGQTCANCSCSDETACSTFKPKDCN